MDDLETELKDPHLRAAMNFPVTASLGPAGPLLRQLRLLTTRPEGVSEDEIRRLTKDLDGLCISLMHHSEAEEPLSSSAKSWMSEVRELCYDTKNYLDDAITSRHKKKTARSKFKILEARAEHAKQRRQRYEIDHQSINKPRKLASRVRRLPVLHPELIDRGRMDKLATLLHEKEGQQLKVVSVVGLEGVGKTTIAKRIYHKIKTGGQFDCGAFVRVSPNPDMRRLLASVFTQIQLPWGFSSSSEGVSQPACCSDAQELITNIKDYLRGKRYFITVDDLWTTSVWDIIRRAFPDGDHSSRIITTTQFGDVASACSNYQSNDIFKMEPLKYDESRILLFGMLFGNDDKVSLPKGFGEVSSEIIEKCGGLPLSVINIGSLLPTEEDKINPKQWMDIRDSLPSTLRKNPTSEGIKEVLNLTYNNLSPELKTCLLYLVVYPEGYTVYKDDLVKQWVIEGFIGEGQNQEEIAEGYFDELVSRGMIQVVDINYNGVFSCTLHHTVHDLIVNKSMEENFIISVDYFQSAIGLLDKVRRLSVQLSGTRSTRIPAGIMMSEVRSLAFFGFCGYLDFIEEYKHLVVLTLDVWADKDEATYDLSGISKLIPLRYLKIACNIAVKLPEKIHCLQYLKMLEVDATIIAIPSGIQRLNRLSSVKIAVRELLREHILILQKMGALTTLSLDVKIAPTNCIVFGKGGFLVLNFFTFRCSATWLLIEENAMPKIEKLNVCLNAHKAWVDGKNHITIQHLPSLREISIEIWGAVAEKGSALTSAVSNDARNPIPIVQLMESREDEHGIHERQYEIVEEDHDAMSDYSRKDENTDAGTRITTSTRTDAGISIIRTVYINLHLRVDLACPTEDYASFIDVLRRKLADHPDKAVVHGRPVLSKKARLGKPPARLFMIKLGGHDRCETVTLAVRDDNLDLVGFKTPDGRWYDFGFFPCKSITLLRESTSIGCDGSYQSLLGKRCLLHELKLGRMSAIIAIRTLSAYQHRAGHIVDQETRLAVARLMVMICESARFKSIFDTLKEGWYSQVFLTERQVEYIQNWPNISFFLLGSKRFQSRMSDMEIKDEADAAGLVHMVLHFTRYLVEVIGVRADSHFRGTISVLDKDGGKVITYKNRGRQRLGAASQDKMDLALSGPYRAISTYGKIDIQVDGKAGSRVLRDSTLQDDGVYEGVRKKQVSIDDAGSIVEFTYLVLREAVEKEVKIQLKLKGPHKAGTIARVYGEITAANRLYGDTVLLFSRTKEQEIKPTHTSDGLNTIMSIPLIRYVVAAPLDEPLEIKVQLRAAAYSTYSYKRIISMFQERKKAISLDAHLFLDPNTNTATQKIDTLVTEAEVVVITADSRRSSAQAAVS